MSNKLLVFTSTNTAIALLCSSNPVQVDLDQGSGYPLAVEEVVLQL